MKPKNFPDRKNKRRLVALSHLGPNKPQEEKSLQATIAPYGRRDVRTKKQRGGM